MWSQAPPVLAADRPAAVSGAFYPSDPAELRAEIDECALRASAAPVPEGAPIPAGLIVPHAGYVYSGRTAATAYRLLKGADIDTVILVGPSHRTFFKGAAVWTEGDWVTPLGRVRVDTDLARAIAAENQLFQAPSEAHLGEHSLEVQIPFLQTVLDKFSIVPILTSDPSPANTTALAAAILEHTRDRKAIVLFSTDMSHYRDDAPTRVMDASTLDLIRSGDTTGLYQALAEGRSEMCGAAAVLTALQYARGLSGARIEVLDYTTSADAGGGTQRVVGYGAVRITADARSVTVDGTPAEYDDAQRAELLGRARLALQRRLGGAGEELDPPADPVLTEPRAVFVTLRQEGRLRGCIGGLYATEPLHRAVEHMAEAAARDPRFKRLKASELAKTHIEISVLSPPRRVSSAEEIVLGRDGVIVRSGQAGGVFLPQVAQETGWTKERFLSELCSQKAGLAPDCWQDPQTELYVFTCEVFEEAT